MLGIMLRQIPLNALTLYADLDTRAALEREDAGTVSRRLEGGQRRLYASVRDGVRLRQIYIGTVGDAKAEAKARAYQDAMERGRQRRKTVTALKRLGIPAPPLEVGRVIEAMSRAGLFEAGAVLAGTAAFQCYPCLVGHVLPPASLMTRDVDISLARLAVPKVAALRRGLEDILQEADPSFKADMRGEKAPKHFTNRDGFIVDVLTTPGRTSGPVMIRGLAVYATPLPFMDYLINESVPATALYGRGVPVRVPDPARFAFHKLAIAKRRRAQRQKAPKDVAQAWALIEALSAFDRDGLDAALVDAKRRGGDIKAAGAEVATKLETMAPG